MIVNKFPSNVPTNVGVKVETGSSSIWKYLTGPLEFLLDVPIHLGCFKNVKSSNEPQNNTYNPLTPASCIRACLLTDEKAYRFAGNQLLQ